MNKIGRKVSFKLPRDLFDLRLSKLPLSLSPEEIYFPRLDLAESEGDDQRRCTLKQLQPRVIFSPRWKFNIATGREIGTT